MGYRGEWFIPLTNTNNVPVIIAKDGVTMHIDCIMYPYSKGIAQVIMVEVPKLSIEEVSVERIKSIPSERGEGCLGSSGK